MFATVLRRVANLPIVAKLLLAPSVSILLLSLIVPMSLHAIGRQSVLLTRLTTVAAERHAVSAALARALPEASNQLNRLIALRSNSDDVEAGKRTADALDAALARTAELVDRLGAYAASPEERQVIESLRKPLADFTTSARLAAKMAQSDDAASAFITGNQSSRQYAALMAGLDALNRLDDARTLADRTDAEALAGTVRTGVWGVFAAGLAAAVLVTLLLARLIGGSIKSLTRSMLRLAEGDVAVAIDGATQRDEVGEMARALEVFRASLIRERDLHAETERQQAARDARTRRVARIALPARQRLLVRPARHFFPEAERLPVQRVEVPNQTRRRAAPRFEVEPVGLAAPRERARHLHGHVVLSARRAPQIDADL